jgi:hypothetical protein
MPTLSSQEGHLRVAFFYYAYAKGTLERRAAALIAAVWPHGGRSARRSLIPAR